MKRVYFSIDVDIILLQGRNNKLIVDSRIRDQKDSFLRVFHGFTPEQYIEYSEYLLKLRDDKLQTKEQSYFNSASNKFHKCDFWWDIENDVMWTFSKPFSKILLGCLEASWKYMEASKA